MRAAPDDFASALLVRLTQQELARQGLLTAPRDARPAAANVAAPATGASPTLQRPMRARRRAFGPTFAEARVALTAKRALLAAVAERSGYRPLLLVGEGLARLVAESPDDPVLAALVRATDPFEALARWQRLERFLHSRHRLELVASVVAAPARHGRDRRARPTGDVDWSASPAVGGNVLVVRHVGPPGAPPAPAEDALILGVMVALCRYVGAPNLTVSLLGEDGAAYPILTAAGFREPPATWCHPGALATWRFAWSDDAERGTGAAGPRATGAPPEARPLATPLATSLATRLAAVIGADLARSWTLATAARALDHAGGPSVAPRTLQRRLAAEQATFPGVVRSARVAAAGRLLADGALAIGVIGFVCGFSDQAHFTRQFRRQTGLTPAAYRRLVGDTVGGARAQRAGPALSRRA
jgi:AraC-like DNA-binding protein